MPISGTYYDGISSRRFDITLSVSDRVVHIKGDSLDSLFKVDDIQIKPKLANLPTHIVFPDGSHCELPEQDGLHLLTDLIPDSRTLTWIHRIENRFALILFTLIIAVLILFLIIRYAIPFTAKHVAYKIPLSVEQSMADEGLAVLDKIMFKPSKLPLARKNELIEYFNKVAAFEKPLDIRFRSSKAIGENAFALPSGIIIFTDDMVNFAEDDRELLGIFAHEVGHVKKRHVLRHLLQDSTTGLLLILITGDVGSASSLVAAVPTILIQAKFSREFESEADDYAIDFLTKRNVSTHYLADILDRLQLKHKETDSEINAFLSSHPATAKRLLKLKADQH